MAENIDDGVVDEEQLHAPNIIIENGAQFKTFFKDIESFKTKYADIRVRQPNLVKLNDIYTSMYNLLHNVQDSVEVVLRFHATNHFKLLLFSLDELQSLAAGLKTFREKQMALMSRIPLETVIKLFVPI